ncbi:MAG: hypothetical protein GW886_03930 [Rhodobacterales bacterium]|nr:hypothetical protein [Rhodobacterales bacterium]
MATGGHDGNDSFLPLAEAAARLGISRLKLREAIAKGAVPARRDNEGRWRVDLATLPAEDPTPGTATPEALMGALFDEIEELSADLEDATALTARLTALAGAQGDALDRVTAALEATVAERDRLGDLAGRALAAADEAEARASALQATADRAIGLLDRATGTIGAMQDDLARLKADAAAKQAALDGQAAQLDRLFSLSEQALQKAAETRRAPGLIARVLGTGRRGN